MHGDPAPYSTEAVVPATRMAVKLTVSASSRCMQTESAPRAGSWLVCQLRRLAASSDPRARKHSSCERRQLATQLS